MSAPDHSATRGRAPRPTPFARQHVWLVLAAAGLSLIACGPVRGSAGADPPPCAAPSDLGDGWHSASAADTRMDADALCALLRSVAERPDNIHSLLVARRGQLVAELYRRRADRSLYSFYASDRKFGPGDRHDVRSISKSVVGLLVGIAVAQGTSRVCRALFSSSIRSTQNCAQMSIAASRSSIS